MKNLSLRNICGACCGEIHYQGDVDLDKEVTCAVIDSRKIEPGGLFIATKGERVDGHSFIKQVFEKGALGVICEELPEEEVGPCIVVEDSFKALRDIAAFYRKNLSIPVVGITGSVGKTSTKEFVASVVGKKYNTWYTQGNFNNEIGMPLTILQTREEHEALVLEMGINHFGEMDRLSAIAVPDIMVITNIGECHLEFLGDRDGVLKAKTECFNHLAKDARVILNGDDDKLVTVKDVCGKEPLFFSKDRNDCDYVVNNCESRGLFGSKAKLESKITGDIIDATIPLPGQHMINNALAAMAVGELMDISPELIAEGIADVPSTQGRSNIIDTGKYVLIDDCYNANPTSMKAALNLLNTADTRKVAIMGDMFELGEEECRLHEEVGNYASLTGVDVIICVGRLSENMYNGAVHGGNQNCYYFKSLDDAVSEVEGIIRQGDTILIKASHSMGFEKIVKLFNN